MVPSALQATLSVDNTSFLKGLKQSQSAVDAFAVRATAKLGAINADRGFNKIHQQFNRAGSAAAQFTGKMEKMGNVFTGGLGLGVAAGGLALLAGGFTRAIEKAREFETGILSIAAAQQSAFDIMRDGKMLEGVEAFKASLSIADKANQVILERSTKNILTYREQLNAYLVSTAQASKIGLNVKEQLELSENLAVAAKAIGLSGQQISQQVRAVLGGANVQKTVLGSALGLTNADLKRMKEAGTLFDELMQKTSGFTAGSGFFENSIEGMLSQFENAIDIFLAGAGRKIAEAVRKPLDEIQKYLASEGGDKLGETLGKLFATVLEVLLAIAKSPAIPIIMKFLDFLGSWGAELTIIAIFSKLIVLMNRLVAGGLNFAQTLSRIAAHSTQAAAGVTALNAAASGGAAMGRGPNASGRFGGADGTKRGPTGLNSMGQVVPAVQNKAGRWVEEGTNKYVRGGGNYLSGGVIAQQEMKATQDAIDKSLKNQFKGIRASLANMDANAVVGKVGMAVMAYSLVEYGMRLITNQFDKDSPAGQALETGAKLASGAVGGGMLLSGVSKFSGAVGALGGAAISYLGSVTDSMQQAAQEAERAESALKAQLRVAPEAAKLREIQDKIDQQKSAMSGTGSTGPQTLLEILFRENNTVAELTDKGKQAALKRIKELEELYESTKAEGTATRRPKKIAADFNAGLKKTEDLMALLPETLNNSVKKSLVSLAQKLNKIQEAEDADIERLSRGGESPQATRDRLTNEVFRGGMDEIRKTLQSAALETTKLGFQLNDAGVSVKKAKQEFDNFNEDIPKTINEFQTKIGTAAETYLVSLTKGSDASKSVIDALQKRASAESETAALAHRYGINQTQALNALYGFESGTNAMTEANKVLKRRTEDAADAYRGAVADLNELRKSFRANAAEQDRLNQEENKLIADRAAAEDAYTDALRQAAMKQAMIGSDASNLLSERTSLIEANARAAAFAQEQLGISGVKSAEELDNIIRGNGKAVQDYFARFTDAAQESALAEYTDAQAAAVQITTDYNAKQAEFVQRFTELAEQRIAAEEAEQEIRSKLVKAEEEAQVKREEMNRAREAQELMLAEGYQRYIGEIYRTTEAMTAGQIAENGFNMGAAMRDYTQMLDGLGDETQKLRDNMSSASISFFEIDQKLKELKPQLAEAQANFLSATHNVLYGNTGKDVKMDVNVPIQVDATLQQIVDPAKLEKEVQGFIADYLRNQCRDVKRG
jgi:hypothetical protein